MDQSKIDGFKERLFAELNSGMSRLTLDLGFRLGLFQALAEAGQTTSQQLADKTGCAERYIREWLECMAAGKYVDYDPTTGRFALPPEHKTVLLDPDSRSSAMGTFGLVASYATILPQLLEAFRTGGGVSYEDYGLEMVSAQGYTNRPVFTNDYTGTWIAAMPDVEEKLKQGGRVAEVGCGVGWSSIALARGFPAVHVDGIDPDELSIQSAQANIAEAGLTARISLHQATLEDSPIQGPYELVTAFECLHDMPYPVSVLSKMRELAAPSGAVLIAEEAVGDTLEENRNFMGHMLYNFSVLHCLPQAMGFPDSAGTGTVIKPSIFRGYAQEAGFTRVEILPVEHPQFRLYRLHQ